MPWLNTPQHRQTTFIEPLYPRGGLLGGSGAPPKMSKLQQLAAARKKKAEEQKAAEQSKENESSAPVKSATKQLSSLSVNPREGSKDMEPAPTSTGSSFGFITPKFPVAETKKSTELAQPDGAVIDPSGLPVARPLEEPTPVEPAAPSEFAQALLGPAQTSAPVPRTSYPLPYMAFTSSVTDAFSGPSPDDVVLTAQAKGSLLGARKA